MLTRSLLLLLVVAALAGCDNEIDTPDSLRGTYTLWGALDPTADLQSVRVTPVTDSIGLGGAEALPVQVASVNLRTGEEAAWRDSVVTFRDGSVGHIFNARFRAEYGGRYRIVVRRDEGGEVSALVAVPPRVEPVPRPPTANGPLRVSVLWPAAPQLNRVRVTYELAGPAGSAVVDRANVPDIDPFDASPVEFGWESVIDVSADASAVQTAAGGPVGSLELVRVRITAEVASEDWRPPGGVFDFDVLADPGILTNVRGGFGFVGAAYPVEVVYEPTVCELRRTTFRRLDGAC